MRGPRRLRFVLPAVGIPLGVAALCLGIQAAALPRPSRDTLVASAALRELLRYRVMRSTELIAGHVEQSTCVEGWYRSRHHRHAVRGAIVLLGNGEVLYDIGFGIQRIGRAGPVSRLDEARFLLASCPRVVGEDVAARRLRGGAGYPDPARSDGSPVRSLEFGHPQRRLLLSVLKRTYAPVALRLIWQGVSGRSDLAPGGGLEAISRVQRGFALPRGRPFGA